MIDKKKFLGLVLLLTSIPFLNGSEVGPKKPVRLPATPAWKHFTTVAGDFDISEYRATRFFLIPDAQVPETAWETKPYPMVPVKLEVIAQYPLLRDMVKEYWEDGITKMKLPLGHILETRFLKGRIGIDELRTFVKHHEFTVSFKQKFEKRIGSLSATQLAKRKTEYENSQNRRLEILKPKTLINNINLANALGGIRTKEEQAKAAAEGVELKPTFMEKCVEILAFKVKATDVARFFDIPLSASSPKGLWLQKVSELIPDDILNYVFAQHFELKDYTIEEFRGYTATALESLPNNRIAIGFSDGTIVIFDLSTHQKVATLTGHDGAIMALALLPNNRLASGSFDSTVNIWDLNTHQKVATLAGHDAIIMALALLPNNRLASGSIDSTTKIWDLETHQEVAILPGAVFSLLTLPNNQLVVGGYGTIKTWNLNTFRETGNLTLRPNSVVTAFALTPDNNLVSGDRNGTIKKWNLNNLQAPPATWAGNGKRIIRFVLQPNNILTYGEEGGDIKKWNLENNEIIETVRQAAGMIDFIVLQNNQLATAFTNGTVKVQRNKPIVKNSLTQVLAVHVASLIHDRGQPVTATEKLRAAIKSLTPKDRAALDETGWLRMIRGL